MSAHRLITAGPKNRIGVEILLTRMAFEFFIKVDYLKLLDSTQGPILYGLFFNHITESHYSWKINFDVQRNHVFIPFVTKVEKGKKIM